MRKVLLTILLFMTMFSIFKIDAKADNVVVVIDPGHGGDNLGAQVDGVIEKEINLIVANAMYERLSLYEGIEVHMTRQTDKGLTLKKRAQIAQEYNADYLIALHFNASESHKLYGTECWVPYDNFYEETYEMAAYYIDELTNMGLFNRGIKTRLNDDGDNYYGIIRESETRDIPCLLVEHCHMDNETDKVYLKNETELKKLGEADAEALAKYLGLRSKQLGTDYSNYSLDVNIPLSENTRDKTGPDECTITVKDYSKENGKLQFILTAYEKDSSLLFYEYSVDGGITYSNLYPMTAESVEIAVEFEDGYTPEIVARVCNLNDVFTESNNISLDTVDYPELDVDTITISPLDKQKQEQREKIIAIMILTLILLVICFVFIFVLQIVKSMQRKKRRQRRYQQHKKQEEL